jgi:hypothetical protein
LNLSPANTAFRGTAACSSTSRGTEASAPSNLSFAATRLCGNGAARYRGFASPRALRHPSLLCVTQAVTQLRGSAALRQSGNPQTQCVWSLAAPTPDCLNWIARWFLYHKFRYRDGRNRNPAKSSGTGKHYYSHGHRDSSKHYYYQSEEHEDYYEHESHLTESMTLGVYTALNSPPLLSLP